METIIAILSSPVLIALIGTGGLGVSLVKIFGKINDNKTQIQLRKLEYEQKSNNIIKSNYNFWVKYFNKVANNIKIWHYEKIKSEIVDNDPYMEMKFGIDDLDNILSASIIEFNSENDYLGIEEQMKLKNPLRMSGLN